MLFYTTPNKDKYWKKYCIENDFYIDTINILTKENNGLLINFNKNSNIAFLNKEFYNLIFQHYSTSLI